MLKFELVQTDKHSIKILLRRKNLRFLRRTNHIQTVVCNAKNDEKLFKFDFNFYNSNDFFKLSEKY